MESKNVKIVNLISALVRMDNSTDESRTYDIAANVGISGSGNQVNNFDTGTVEKEGVQVAVFSCYGGQGNLSISYQGIEPAEQVQVLEAVSGFMQEVEQAVQEGGLTGITA